jgi:hypothetical protein
MAAIEKSERQQIVQISFGLMPDKDIQKSMTNHSDRFEP